MNKCIVFCEEWQIACCGNDFSVGTKIKWLVCKGSQVKTPIKIDNIDYYYEAHTPHYKNMLVLEGNVKWIKAFYQKYDRSKEDPKVFVGVDGMLCDIESNCDVVDKKENMDFSAYIVCVENFSVRPALESEVTFR